MNKIRKLTAAWLASVLFIMQASMTVFAAQPYEHDPMANPKAAQDIVVNPNAVYGYSPSPDSKRLREFVDYNWSDPAVVNEMRAQREAYHESMQELYAIVIKMRAEGKPASDIAWAVSTRRNEIRLEAYKDDPEGLAKVKKSNLENYGNENGGTPGFFYDKYGSWEAVIEKALSTNAGADACLGLYDKYYDTYLLPVTQTAVQNSTPQSDTPAPAEAAADTVYTVISGDTLIRIAEKVYGNAADWRVLYDLNADSIRDPNRIFVGQELKIR